MEDGAEVRKKGGVCVREKAHRHDWSCGCLREYPTTLVPFFILAVVLEMEMRAQLPL